MLVPRAVKLMLLVLKLISLPQIIHGRKRKHKDDEDNMQPLTSYTNEVGIIVVIKNPFPTELNCRQLGGQQVVVINDVGTEWTINGQKNIGNGNFNVPAATSVFPGGASASLTILEYNENSWFSVVLQPKDPDFQDSTGLNFVVVTVNLPSTGINPEPEVNVNFLQGGYTQDQLDFDNYDSSCSFANDSGNSNTNTTVYYTKTYCSSDGSTNKNFFICPWFNINNQPAYWYGQAYDACETDASAYDTSFTYESTYVPTVQLSDNEFVIPQLYIDLQQYQFSSYVADWLQVAVGGSQSITQTTSWTYGSTSTETVSGSFTVGVSESVQVGFGSDKSTTTLSASATVGISESLSQSLSGTTSSSTTCKTDTCNGILYQWQVTGTNVDGSSEFVQDCYFTCVSLDINSPPKCPLGSCVNSNCQCCNNDDWSTEDVSDLLVENGCVSGCSSAGAPCDVGSDCCSGRCDVGPYQRLCG